ncbi:uncharacterized protein TNCV_5002671 [Trichonephila clavipes]|nr:uncharacterized protein TNCV_5002671 [Trichonephila clavipes]
MDSLVLNRLSLSDSRLRYGFSGVYSSDKLPKQRKCYRSFIVNTDPAHFKGQHWQAIYFRQDNHCVFFCSYGTRHQYDIEQFIIENSTSFEWNENILQHLNTMTCCFFWLYFLWHISRGLPINRLRNGNHCANERLVQYFAQRKKLKRGFVEEEEYPNVSPKKSVKKGKTQNIFDLDLSPPSSGLHEVKIPPYNVYLGKGAAIELKEFCKSYYIAFSKTVDEEIRNRFNLPLDQLNVLMKGVEAIHEYVKDDN